MNTDNNSQKKQVNISTVDGMIHVLQTADIATRVAVLRAIVEKSEKVKEMATKSGVDLFEKLVNLCETTKDHSIRKGFVYVLLYLDNGTYAEFAKNEFLTTNDSDITILAAQNLAKISSDERLRLLTPVVMELGSYTKSRAAANLIAHCDISDNQLAIRVASLSDHKHKLPTLDESSLSDWIEELQGPCQYDTQKLLLMNDNELLFKLLLYWDKLPESIKVWAFKEIITCELEDYEPFIREVIAKDESKKLLLIAFDVLQRIPLKDETDELISSFYIHDDDEICAAAIKAGHIERKWSSLYEEGMSEMVCIAIVSQISRFKQKEECAFLASLLCSKSWRIRATVTNALVNLAPDSLKILQELLKDSNMDIRVSAVKAMKMLGEYNEDSKKVIF
ncbi:MAG: hypothetical protein C0603_06245 [Denitrovibrio sp.]|nr:MAG: hypothetical protein C0603_06245 [Denitrovibrio sp.]